MKKFTFKVIIYILFFVSFVFYVVLGGVDDFIKAETNYINSEVQLYRQDNNLKIHEYVPLDVVKEFRRTYESQNNKQETIVNNQEDKVLMFSILTFFVTLVSVLFLDAGYFYVLIFIFPFIHFFNQLYDKTGSLNFYFLVLPSLVLLVVCIIKLLISKKEKLGHP